MTVVSPSKGAVAMAGILDETAILWRFTLWLFNIAMEHGPFIDGLPIKMVIFHGYVSHNQMVTLKNRDERKKTLGSLEGFDHRTWDSTN